MSDPDPTVDPATGGLLYVAAHPDDAELSCGGTLRKAADAGHRVVICDLTRGETASRGTPELRAEEAAASATVLGVAERLNLGYPDGGVRPNPDFVRGVVEVIRRVRPATLIAPYWRCMHPDHVGTSEIVQEAYMLCGVGGYDAGGLAPYRPNRLLFAMYRVAFTPSFIVDVSDQMDRAVESWKCYASQFHQDDPEAEAREQATTISHPKFFDKILARRAFYGSMIGVDYGEPFHCVETLEIDDVVTAFPAGRPNAGIGFER
ncbi:MAG: bacillithiol biosynthesis deacetylase BshB1 [Planctomycetota bacterium]|jgi:bacillithiol biosynthesis deacetylase BshB1